MDGVATVETGTLTPNRAAAGRACSTPRSPSRPKAATTRCRCARREPAPVALGTIYRYSSKDHLLAACQLEIWRCSSAASTPAPNGETAADRSSTCSVGSCAVEREPLRAAALITASSSPDPAVRECQLEMIGLQDQIFEATMGDLDAARKAQIAQVLRQVWFAALLGWVNGWTDADAVTVDFEIAVRLLFDDLP
jgi:hypothetical protein